MRHPPNKLFIAEFYNMHFILQIPNFFTIIALSSFALKNTFIRQNGNT